MSGTHKLTKNQQVVLAALQDSGGPLSAYQILDQDDVRAKGLKAPLTIYRALEKLVQLGFVHRIESLNAFVLCDRDEHKEPPAFMICQDCKHIIEVGLEGVQRTVEKQAKEQGFVVECVHLEVTGRCRDCAD